jgi:hypothetical protein
MLQAGDDLDFRKKIAAGIGIGLKILLVKKSR